MVHHYQGGIKIIDRAARCPITNRRLLDNPFIMSGQSINLCIPLKIMMGRETKQIFTEFASFFQFLDDLSTAATIPVTMQGFPPIFGDDKLQLVSTMEGSMKGVRRKCTQFPAQDVPLFQMIY